VIKSHPLAEKYPLLEGDDYEELKESIRLYGLLNPIWLYEGKILDGRNRYRACRELGIEPEFARYEGDQPEGFGKAQNVDRRHLTAEWRRQQVKTKRAEGKSTRQIAEEVGASQATVRRDLSGESHDSPAPDEDEERSASRACPEANGPTGESPHSKVTGRDGKKYAAKKPRGKRPKKDAPRKEIKAIVKQLKGLADSLNDGRGFWADARNLEDKDRWLLADELQELSYAMARRATQLRNGSRL
jgi:predicted transcriptional regulator